MSDGEERAGVSLTNLDQPAFEGAGASKRELVDYLDAVSDRMVRVLRDRPLSVMRVLRGQGPFMQKNLPKYTPEWVERKSLWADASKRDVSYALCNDRRTLLWFGNQRAIEYHPTLFTKDTDAGATHLVLDLDPPAEDDAFPLAVAAALLVRQALKNSGLDGAVKTSGSKGVHVFVPLVPGYSIDDTTAATRAVATRAEEIDPQLGTTEFVKENRHGRVFLDSTRAGGGTVASVYSPRIRPGLPVSFPVPWGELESVKPADFTIHTAPALLEQHDAWAAEMPEPQRLPDDLIAHGHTIPIARVAAMHEGKRRKRAAQKKQENG